MDKDKEISHDTLSRIHLAMSLLEGDVGRLQEDLARLEGNLRGLRELMDKIEDGARST